MASNGQPVLWHLPVSHYSEKARWALDYKGIEHGRKAPPPPAHMLLALAFTRGRHATFPVLRLDGRRIGDSTAIIAALEGRYPDPPLYPRDPAERTRALELEDWFDEELGPNMRVLVWHEVTHDPRVLRELSPKLAPGPRRLAPAGVRSFVNLRYGVRTADAAERARRKVGEALDRVEAELGQSDYLVGERFSVADLTAAALLYPLVLPPEGPRLIESHAERMERFRASLAERRAYRWVEEMFRRHRRRSAAP